jgi:carbon-monoxide dehydrogenase medium subunit
VFVARTKGAVRVAVTGARECVYRATAMESASTKSFTPDALNGIVISPEGLNEDISATREYRVHLIGVMARRAVAAAR